MLVGGSLRSVLLACSTLLLGVSMMCLSTGVGMQMVDNRTLLQTRIVMCCAVQPYKYGARIPPLSPCCLGSWLLVALLCSLLACRVSKCQEFDAFFFQLVATTDPWSILGHDLSIQCRRTRAAALACRCRRCADWAHSCWLVPVYFTAVMCILYGVQGKPYPHVKVSTQPCFCMHRAA
jgi:hypothetical protein